MTVNKSEITAKLYDSRQQLMTFFEGLDDAAWATAVYDENTTWTITDILRHLVDSERGMTGMMAQWQQGNDPIPPDFDLARWNSRAIQKTAEKSPQELLHNMQENRASLLGFINTLQDEDWSKQGRHGSLRIMSIEEVCHLIANHEMDHLRVMQELLA
ncbi:MAG: DinB family protein [Anaerolineales bacterium]|nr:DinB family protein [Anaerolineales bacterium]MCB8937045.1 DinB family protein [Ardenticatenaceae bacterium]